MILRYISKLSLSVSAAMFVGMQEASAANFSTISENIVTSIEGIPGLLSGVAYLFGLLLGVLGILKVKDHVENPAQTPLKDGAIRMACGGALFALPIVFEAMQVTIGETSNSVSAADLNAVTFSVR
jgi:hypothetical protein